MKKIKERFEPNDILTLSSGFLARYAGSNKYGDIERFQNNLFIWVRDEVAEGRKFNSHIEALKAFIAERDEYRRTHNTYEIEVFESVKIVQEDHDIILEKGDKIRVFSENNDVDLQRVADIVDQYEGLFGLEGPLEKVFGKGKVKFWGYSAIIVTLKDRRKVIIASPQNVKTSGGEIPVLNGNLLVGYGS